MTSDERFPAAVYAETVLEVHFREAQRHFLDSLLEIDYAHTLMLARQRIIPLNVARRCIKALDELDRDQIATAAWDRHSEDLFFHVERLLDQAIGVENSGYMHTARSRNDVAITQYRMRLRSEILEIVRHLNALRHTLVEMASRHIDTLMPAYTHTQPAQPITFAHYLVAVIEQLGRDERRFQAAFATVNRCPLGACAIATTGFPIDRHFTAELLRFEGLQLNSYGAIAATDYISETAGAIATAMLGLGRVTQDFLLWCTAEFGYLRLSDAWVQISSIMPQKRNPVPLEHVRILASKALAHAQGILTALHNTPFGDINDSEDSLQPVVFAMCEEAIRALRLFSGVLRACEINTERMADRAHSDFLTVTELADSLVRLEGVSFRQAHHLVSAAVQNLHGRYSPSAMVDSVVALAPGHLGHSLRIEPKALFTSLDPIHFVNVRRIPGGPAAEAVSASLNGATGDLDQTSTWLEERRTLLAAYPKQIRESCDQLLTE